MMPQYAASPVCLAEPDRPFWGFGELFLIVALFVPAVLIGAFTIKEAAAWLHFDAQLGLPLLVAQFIGYGIVFLGLKGLFARYREPLFASLGWVESPFRPIHLIALGLILAVAVVLLGNVMSIPNVETPFDKLLDNMPSRIGIAIFGITLGPIVEELLFRGFVQPVLVSSLGVFPGILATSAIFGAMHLMQNAFLWQTGVLITLVGFVLGVVRHVSGSTRASAIVHIFYNALPFLALFIHPPS